MSEEKEGEVNMKHFTKLNEKIRSKYADIQRRLEKSKSVDAIGSLEDEFTYKEQSRCISNDNLVEPDEEFEAKKTSLTQTVIVEEVVRRNAKFHDVYDEGSPRLSESMDDFLVIEQNEFVNEYNYNSFTYSIESLNELGGDSDSCSASIPSTPPHKISIRDRISSKISARRQRRKAEKEKAANENKNKETREKVEKFILSNTTKQDYVKAFKKNRLATVTIALIQASGFENESEEKPRFMYCRFKLGSEKYKSKVTKSNQSVVKWQELFNFSMYEENMLEITLWDKDFYIGRYGIDLLELDKEITHKMNINLECETGSVKLFILLTITGTSLANNLVDIDDYEANKRRMSSFSKKLSWFKPNNKTESVGLCSIIVYGAKGLSSNECYCILELANNRVHTHTETKTNDPNWMKIFTFDVKDITTILEVTVHDERKSEDVGKISIPLLNIRNGKKVWYALKDSMQRDRAKGNNPRILLEMYVSWNPILASIRVINPKEEKYLEFDDKLQRHIFARNLSRAKAVFSWIMDAFRVLKTCFEWESRKSNVVALTTWLLFCWFFKMWMLPLLLLIPFVWYRPENYYLIRWKKYFNNKASTELEEASKKDKEEKNTSLRQKINSLQEMVQTVQNFIGKFASLGESIKNLFNFKVPFLSQLAIIMISLVALVMFLIPVQYIFMIWGIHKFTRKILRPNRIPNNEILDLLSRVPDDETLDLSKWLQSPIEINDIDFDLAELDIQELQLEELPEEDVIK